MKEKFKLRHEQVYATIENETQEVGNNNLGKSTSWAKDKLESLN